MPFYEFKCKDCDSEFEELMGSYEEKEPWLKEHRCSCGGQLQTMISKIARTVSLWGDQTGTYGVNGVYNRGLGCMVYNDKDMEQKAKARGLVPYHQAYDASTFHEHLDTVAESDVKKFEQHNRNVVKYTDLLDKYGKDEQGKMRAQAETFTVESMKKAGTLVESNKTGVVNG